MKKSVLFGFAVVAMSLSAKAETVCLGKVGQSGLGTVVTVFDDGANKIEIKQEGDTAYTGQYEVNHGVLVGNAFSESGNKLDFKVNLYYSKQEKAPAMNITILMNGYSSKGSLKCVALN